MKYLPKSLTPPLDFRFLDLLIILLMSTGAIVLVIFVISVGKDIIYPLEIQTSLLPDGIQGHHYKEKLFARGGEEPYVWTATELPAGLQVNSNGFLEGVPTVNGNFAVNLFVKDSKGRTAEETVELKVIDFGFISPLELKTNSLPPGRVQAKYELAMAAEGGLRPYEWTFYDLPEGLQGADATIKGIPEKQGIFPIMVELKDALSQKITKKFDFQIFPNVIAAEVQDLEPLQISTIAPHAVAGIPYELQLSAKGGIPPYQWQLLTNFPGLELTIDGLIRLEDPSKWRDGWAFQVRVFDSVSEYTVATIYPKIVRPTKFFQKILVALAVIGAWALSILLLKRFSSAKRFYFGEWDVNLTTVLSTLFFFVATVVTFNAYAGTLFFIFCVILLATYVFFNYT